MVRFGKFNRVKYKDVDLEYLKWLNEKGFWDDFTKLSSDAVIKNTLKTLYYISHQHRIMNSLVKSIFVLGGVSLQSVNAFTVSYVVVNCVEKQTIVLTLFSQPIFSFLPSNLIYLYCLVHLSFQCC